MYLSLAGDIQKFLNVFIFDSILFLQYCNDPLFPLMFLCAALFGVRGDAVRNFCLRITK